MKMCPRCDAPLSFLADYPQCLMCGFENYAVTPGYQYRQRRLVRLVAQVDEPRPCAECGADISDRYRSAVYCIDCLFQRTREMNRKSSLAYRAAKRLERMG